MADKRSMHASQKFGIVVPCDTSDPSYRNKKGRSFQRLVADFLLTQSFDIKEEFRDGGTEIDLLCLNRLSQDLIVAECKARSEPLKAESINKIHTDVDIYDA